MIDWLTTIIPCVHVPVGHDRVEKRNEETGEVYWSKNCGSSVRSSAEGHFLVTSIGGDGSGQATHLKIDGNPCKFLQGHNVFGSNDLLSLFVDTVDVIVDQLGLVLSDADISAIRRGFCPVLRVDINESFSCGSLDMVRQWIRACEFKSKTRHGRPSMKGSTLYWGKSSKRWSLKAYSKYDDISRFKKPFPLHLSDDADFLKSWASDKLRLELCLRSLQLKDLGLPFICDLDVLTVEKLYEEFLGRLDMTEQVFIRDSKLQELPSRLRSTYTLWQRGDDLRDILSRPTYYRHRKELLEFGVNIDMAVESDPYKNVVPLLRYITAEPARMTDFENYGHLMHHSGRVI